MMKTFPTPLPTTLFFGLICGLAFIPMRLVLDSVLAAHSAIGLTLWLYVAGYAILLSRWSKKGLWPITFPLLLLFLLIFLAKSMIAFLLFTLVVIGWIRSGICFRSSIRAKLWVELLLGAIGTILAAAFSPASAAAGSLGVWMFFLVQALYFVIVDDFSPAKEIPHQPDPFERARTLAEDILSTRLDC
jgi:hypothetical protein